MSLPFENVLLRERARQRRQSEGGQRNELSARMETPTLSPAGVGSASAPSALDTRLMDLVAELTAPVDPTRLSQEIEEFNLSYPIDVDTALNVLSVPPVAGVGTEPAPTTTTSTTQTTTTRHHLHPNPTSDRHHHRPHGCCCCSLNHLDRATDWGGHVHQDSAYSRKPSDRGCQTTTLSSPTSFSAFLSIPTPNR